MKYKFSFLLVMICCQIQLSHGQTVQSDTADYRHFLGTSLWSIANLFPDPGDFYELDYGYRFTAKDVVMVRAITWKYNTPLGIPYGPSFESPNEEYPGFARAVGMGVGYQRYLWKGLFVAGHSTFFFQQFRHPDKQKIQNGFQLFLQAQTGYRFPLFRNRCYIEPSIAFNYWPVNTNFPASFLLKEATWPNYFLFEPHLNIGVNF